MKQISKLWADDSGATAVEYGLMVAAIAAVIIATVFAIGRKVEAGFVTVETNLP
ncbi:MAG TPA: Flp family type IVb pilin [Myxococcales bacterium]|jgi:pilus assembly protein Flp/PilA